MEQVMTEKSARKGGVFSVIDVTLTKGKKKVSTMIWMTGPNRPKASLMLENRSVATTCQMWIGVTTSGPRTYGPTEMRTEIE